MAFIDAFVAAVPNSRRSDYNEFLRKQHKLIKNHGALRIVDCWEADVPDGKLTSFPLAVKREAGEAVTIGVIEWPSKAIRDAAWAKLMADPEMKPGLMPFDGKRMIFGGFETIMES